MPTSWRGVRPGQIAAPGHIYLTDRTARQVEGYFRLREVGPLQIKGMRDTVRVSDLEDVGPRLDAARSRGFSKFVGRERELAALEDAFDQAAAGHGQVVGVVAAARTVALADTLSPALRARSRSEARHGPHRGREHHPSPRERAPKLGARGARTPGHTRGDVVRRGTRFSLVTGRRALGERQRLEGSSAGRALRWGPEEQ